jgi:pimeloyl-ACP methyl ester carboxylesterase
VVVPEDRSQPKSHPIRLAVAIFKTPNPHPAPDPVLVLGGGPGGPQLATTGPNINARNLTIFAPNRDLILLDQRGVGYSQPPLNCQGKELCAGEGINLNAYTTLENAADVHDLVRALGYTQVNLRGLSYGTRLALTVMRLYPADIRSVELISVYPPQVNGYADRAAEMQHAFNVLFQGCAANAHCNAAYPHLPMVFYHLVHDLNTQPITFQTPQHVPVQFRGDDLMNWLFQALYDTELIPLLPAVLFHMRNHDYTLLSRIYGTAVAANETVSLGLFYSVECGEDMAYTTPQALTASVQVLAPELRPGMLASLLGDYRGCQFWNVKPVPAVQKEPVTSSIPTLIMEGEYDPITPPANGMLTAQTLSRSFFFLFPGVSHGVRTTNLCPREIGQAFLDHPTVKPDASCISSMPEPAFT